MSSETKKRSAAEWFLESFFQERNIKWMLALGVMIVFGSSLMLVTKQWDQWEPLLKALTVVGYSAAVFACGELCFCRLGLHNTGTVMRTLTLLLLPLSFIAINRLGQLGSEPAAVSWLVRGEQVGLLLLDAVLTLFASRRIFTQFLRGSQPTLVASYVTLAVAGGVLSPSFVAGVEPIVALLLWAVFSAGTIKTARQVFWLAEEHKLPRVCGFLPVMLLGAQFLTLFVLTCAGHITLPWLGLGCVLTAVPVLLTTDAIAKVFQQRTGNLVRPLPWSIVLPLFVGLVLSVVGVGMASIGFPFTMALAPSAGLAAMMMLVTARRTGHPAFVWAGLLGAAIAYQSLPAFFQETARFAVSSAASAVHEHRLPVAFYGLTWLPLILATTYVSVRAARRDDRLIAGPARRFTMIVATLLFALCFSHPKAIFPVSAVMTATFGLQAVLFRERRLLIGSAAAWIGLCIGSQTFLNLVCGLPISVDVHQLLMTAGAALLLSIGSWLDRRSLALQSQASDRPIFGIASLLLSVGVAAYWLMVATLLPEVSVGLVTGISLAGLLLAQAWKWPARGIGELAWSFVLAAVVKSSMAWPNHSDALLSYVWTLTPLALWIGSRLLERGDSRLAVALARPGVRISLIALLLMTVLDQAGFFLSQIRLTTTSTLWLPALLLTAWPFDAARRTGSIVLATLSSLNVMVFAASVLIGLGAEQFIPAAWAILAAIGVVATQVSGTALAAGLLPVTSMHTTPVASAVPLKVSAIGPTPVAIRQTSLVILMLTSVLTLLSFGMPMRLAGLIAVAGLVVDTTLRKNRDVRWIAFAIGHWQVAAFVAKCFAPGLGGIGDVLSAAFGLTVLPVALTLAAGVSVLRLRREDNARELLDVHCFGAFLGTAYCLMAGLFLLSTQMTFGQVAAAIATFALLVVSEFILAVRRQKVNGVWMTQALIGAAVAWLFLAGVITIGHGWSMFVCLGAAVVWLVASKMCARNPKTQFAVEALQIPANMLPLATVAIGIVRHITVGDSQLGMNSLALLLASAFYFWQGLESDNGDNPRTRRDRFVVSAIILNIASALLWRDLDLSDPQFFMIPAGLSILGLVELLKREIPESYRDPLRYAGALTILVSPTFHIISGCWLHLISLMVCSVLIALLAIGLRLRALMYSGTAFLIADLFAMVIRGSVDHPNLLWLAGLAIGASVITLGAICENHRERLLTRLRVMTAELQSWK